MTKYFTSDWHLGHANIFKFCLGRQKFINDALANVTLNKGSFEPLEIMSWHYQRNLLETLSKDDEIFFLGDMGWKSQDHKDFLEFADSLDVAKKVLVSGNHDRTWKQIPGAYKEVFDEVYKRGEFVTVDLFGDEFLLSHLPYVNYGEPGKVYTSNRSKLSDYKPSFFSQYGSNAHLPLLCGHVHDTWKIWHNPTNGLWQYNVGVDVNDHRLVSDVEIATAYRRRFIVE